MTHETIHGHLTLKDTYARMCPPVLAHAESSCTSTEESSESRQIQMDGTQTLPLIWSNALCCCTKLLGDTSCYTKTQHMTRKPNNRKVTPKIQFAAMMN